MIYRTFEKLYLRLICFQAYLYVSPECTHCEKVFGHLISGNFSESLQERDTVVTHPPERVQNKGLFFRKLYFERDPVNMDALKWIRLQTFAFKALATNYGSLDTLSQTWNFARALLPEDKCQIVEGFVEFIKIRLWKTIFWVFSSICCSTEWSKVNEIK